MWSDFSSLPLDQHAQTPSPETLVSKGDSTTGKWIIKPTFPASQLAVLWSLPDQELSVCFKEKSYIHAFEEILEAVKIWSWTANSEMQVIYLNYLENVRFKFFKIAVKYINFCFNYLVICQVQNNIWCHLRLFDMTYGCYIHESQNIVFVSFCFIFKPLQTATFCLIFLVKVSLVCVIMEHLDSLNQKILDTLWVNWRSSYFQ